jgi:hypothetical protein
VYLRCVFKQSSLSNPVAMRAKQSAVCCLVMALSSSNRRTSANTMPEGVVSVSVGRGGGRKWWSVVGCDNMI